MPNTPTPTEQPTPSADQAAPSAPEAGTERHPYYAWHIRDHRDSYQDCDVVCREAWDAATDAAQRQHTAALAERDAQVERLREAARAYRDMHGVLGCMSPGRCATADALRAALAAAPANRGDEVGDLRLAADMLAEERDGWKARALGYRAPPCRHQDVALPGEHVTALRDAAAPQAPQEPAHG